MNHTLGKTESANDSTQLIDTTVEFPTLANGCPELCEGCGDPKLHRGKPASSLIACSSCVRALPRWMTEARNSAQGEQSEIWENRIALTLCWMREARQ